VEDETMATPKKTNRLSVGRSSKPAAEQAVPRRSAMPWPSKNAAGRRKPATKKPATPKKPGAKQPAEKRNALSDHGAKRILEELRAIRETLARHEEVLARITARIEMAAGPIDGILGIDTAWSSTCRSSPSCATRQQQREVRRRDQRTGEQRTTARYFNGKKDGMETISLSYIMPGHTAA